MKRIIFLFFTAFSICQTQAQISDDFSDGDFTANPAWQGNTDQFVVNASFELQLMAPAAGTSALFLPLSIPDSCEWNIYLRMEFAPSSSNKTRIYLQSATSDLESAPGYYLEVGEDGSNDAIKLFRRDNASTTALLATATSGAMSGDPAQARIRVTRSPGGQWQILADYSSGNNFTLEASATDATYAGGDALYFGMFCQYTVTRKDKFFFDDILVSGISVPDLTPPVLLSATPASATQLEVLFDEPLDPLTAETGSLYQISPGIGMPQNAALDAGNHALVHLTLPSALSTGQTYTLQTNGIADNDLNVSNVQSVQFDYTVVEQANPFDILINEIMADPTPLVGLPDAEYVELFNHSGKTLNLNGFFLKAGSTTKTLPAYVLAPGDLVVICNAADAPALQAFGPTLGLSGFPALTNTGTTIVLSDPSNNTIDQLSYTDNWYQDGTKKNGGWSLERINPNKLCYPGGVNWIASVNPAGGTPGQANSVLDNSTDNTPLSLVSVEFIDNSSLRAVFNKSLDPLSAAQASHYIVNNGVGPANTAVLSEPTRNSVLLSLSNPLQGGQVYTLTVSDLLDCAGNNIAGTNSKSVVVPDSDLSPYDVLINEIFPDPTPIIGLPEAEYIELYNRSNKVINLAGFQLFTGSNAAVLPYHLLMPDSYVTIYKAAAGISFAPYGDTLTVASFSLSNTGDLIILQMPGGQVMDLADYTLDWYNNPSKDEGGWSMERINPMAPCDGISNWKASDDLNGGTPGQANSVLASQPDTQLPDLISGFPPDAYTIVLTFSEALDKIAAENPANYTVNNGISIASAQFDPQVPAKVTLLLATPLTEGTSYDVSAKTSLTDCVGNPVGINHTIPITLPALPGPGDIVINEVLFNPIPGGSRFVELYNRSNKAFNLGGLLIATVKSDSVYAAQITSDYLFFPGDYVVLTPSRINIMALYTVNFSNALLQNTLPTLDDNAGNVTLYRGDVSGPVVIDSFDYDKSYHSPLLSVVEGVSLERISPDAATQQAANWHSAASTAGYATPTYVNSQYIAGTTPADESITLENSTFSPDDDGYKDYLLLNYAFDKAGYTARIRIYDAKGRLVKELAKQQLTGVSGIMKWDGDNDEGQKARIGIYIILIELVHPDGTTRQIRKTCVVAGKF